MRRFFASALIVVLCLGSQVLAQQTAAPTTQTASGTPSAPVLQAAPPTPNTLMDGTAVKLRLAETVSSSDAKTGQQVPFEVTEDVVVDGVTVLPKGSQAIASVTDASPKKSMGRGGKLNVNVDSARLADGEKVQLRAVREGKGGGHVGAMTGAMVATSIVFFPAAPLFLFIHGKDITIPKGTEVTAFLEGDMKLDMAKFAPQPDPNAPVVASATPTTTAVTIEASVANCDIEVDGNFVGSTPSTVAVAPGQHTITVKKKGFADWSRSMMVAGPTAHLSADLEAKS
jgi:hypothetical protein